jgi:UDP-4-amino-4,6-dideoxy-N-acetyl-beta-L-altrosamine N-acetyltransferase
MTIDAALRPVTPEDGGRLLAWRNLPEIRRWMYSDHEISHEEHERWFAGALAASDRRYWIVELDGAPVGLANLVDIVPAHRRASWAYYLADPSTRGRGLGAFVEYQVIQHVFGELGLNRLCCEVLADNEAVCRLHEKFGFQREGLMRQHVWKGEAPADVVAMALLAEDWREIREASGDRLRRLGFAV